MTTHYHFIKMWDLSIVLTVRLKGLYDMRVNMKIKIINCGDWNDVVHILVTVYSVVELSIQIAET
jgi:hypothetical protein